MSAVSFLGIGLAFLGAPQLLTRFMAARDKSEIVGASFIAVVCIIVFDCGAVLTGMAGRALFPELADSETILPTMSTITMPTSPTHTRVIVPIGYMNISATATRKAAMYSQSTVSA